jgi:hypothetical protein
MLSAISNSESSHRLKKFNSTIHISRRHHMALTANVLATQTNRLKEIYVSIAPTNSPAGYVTGGDTFDLTALKNPNFFADPFLSRLPISVGVMNEEMGGYYVGILPGATLGIYKIKFYQPGGSELAAGNYPAAITGGTLHLIIIAQGGVN